MTNQGDRLQYAHNKPDEIAWLLFFRTGSLLLAGTVVISVLEMSPSTFSERIASVLEISSSVFSTGASSGSSSLSGTISSEEIYRSSSYHDLH